MKTVPIKIRQKLFLEYFLLIKHNPTKTDEMKTRERGGERNKKLGLGLSCP